jgi:hypothetical protein
MTFFLKKIPWRLGPLTTTSLKRERKQDSKGYLDQSHYNFSGLEKRHYNSRILKFAIIILCFPPKRHKIRMETTWTQS